jgi:ubiquinone/menaquinone biosynthesis C-methylase UbiE
LNAFHKTYDAEQARRYREQKPPRKHRAEMQLVDRALACIPRPRQLLDVPCGYGRVIEHLHAQGLRVSGADLSEPMLELARESLARRGWSGALERQDLQQLGYPERAFDAVLCFRVFHHFPDAATRRAVVSELCRVAARNVLLSYFSPSSFTSRLSALRVALGLKQPTRYPTPLSELEGYFGACGFRLVRDVARRSFVHSLHISVWERADAVGDPQTAVTAAARPTRPAQEIP